MNNHSYVLGVLLSGTGATIGIIAWEGRHRFRLLILLLGGLFILAGVIVILAASGGVPAEDAR
jgi:hypothetical protein